MDEESLAFAGKPDFDGDRSVELFEKMADDFLADYSPALGAPVQYLARKFKAAGYASLKRGKKAKSE